LVLGYTSSSSKQTTEELAESLRSSHSIRAVAAQADLGTTTGPAELIVAARDAFSTTNDSGEPHLQIDIIINNAGVALNDRLENVKIDDFNTTYQVNVLGPLLLVQAALPYLPTDRSGRIVNLSSVSSSLGFLGQSVYGGTKAALEAMTRTWARELSERCTVNAINPGPALTAMYASNTEEFKKAMSWD
jgi:3-oxoacyl-[acyl-carrier protein] reductase